MTAALAAASATLLRPHKTRHSNRQMDALHLTLHAMMPDDDDEDPPSTPPTPPGHPGKAPPLPPTQPLPPPVIDPPPEPDPKGPYTVC